VSLAAHSERQTPAGRQKTGALPGPARILPVAQSAERSAAQPGTPLRNLHRAAEQKYASVDGYIVRFRRREQVAGKNRPEERILLKFRKEPWSVYLRWLGPAGKGREAVYVKGRYGSQIHSLTGPGDHPLSPAGGTRVQVAPDSPMVLARCRHPIWETGVGALIDRFGQVLDALERGDAHLGTMRSLGPIRRPGRRRRCPGAGSASGSSTRPCISPCWS
jgi:hypothetical protein